MKRTVTGIVIHCSATPNGRAFTAKDIDAWHKERDFKRTPQAIRAYNSELKHIGYHYVIGVDGTIYLGRHIEEVGAHTQGSNAKTIGVCLVGTDAFNLEQMESLKTLLITITNKIQGKPAGTVNNALLVLKSMGISVKGHRDYSPDLNGDGQITRTEWTKICPGFDVKQWLKGLS